MSNYNNDNNSATPKADKSDDKHDSQKKVASDKETSTHATNALGSQKPAADDCGEQKSPDKSVHAKDSHESHEAYTKK